MYERITGESPYKVPMRIYPAPHYTMGGLWVDYNLQSNLPGLFVVGEANFSDHGANRLGASALMQGLADGYFVLPYTIGHYLASVTGGFNDTKHSAFGDAEKSVEARLDKLLSVKGKKSSEAFHRELGYLMLDKVGMARDKSGLEHTINEIRRIREEFWAPGEGVSVPGSKGSLNQSLEKAGRVADFLEFAEVMAYDALMRDESCGGHFPNGAPNRRRRSPDETTKPIPMCLLGSSKALRRRLLSTKKHSNFSMYHPLSGATNNEQKIKSDPEGLASIWAKRFWKV